MVGVGETWFLAAALSFRASRLEQGGMAALSLCAGSFGPLLVLRLLAGFPQRPCLWRSFGLRPERGVAARPMIEEDREESERVD